MYTRLSGEGRYPWCLTLLRACNFFSGVFHTSPSTPGVFLPLFSVTRLIASTLALHERVKRRCKALTLPHRLACVAFTIRACSRRTFRYTLFHLSVDQVTRASENAPGYVAISVICLFSFRQFLRFSCDERPGGSRLTCVWGDLVC